MHRQNTMILMIEIEYYRSSVCAADDYINCEHTIQMPDDAILEDLVQFVTHTNYGHYSFIPYTGGKAFWSLESDNGVLAVVCDDRERIAYPNFDRKKPLNEIRITKIYGKRISEFPT